MAVAKCTKCNNELEGTVKFCPNCGTKAVSAAQKVTHTIVGICVVLIGSVIVIASCSKDGADKKTVKTETADSKKISDAEAAKALRKLMPYYVMEENGQYGYERAISEDDKKAGRQTKSLLMVRYLGEANGTYTVQLKEGGGRQLSSCATPCEFVKIKTYFMGTEVKNETVRAAEGSIIWGIMQDAQNGHLKFSGKNNKGKNRTANNEV